MVYFFNHPLETVSKSILLMSGIMKTIVVIPAYNEAAVIKSVLASIYIYRKYCCSR